MLFNELSLTKLSSDVLPLYLSPALGLLLNYNMSKISLYTLVDRS